MRKISEMKMYGEQACQHLSEPARKFYNETSPLEVLEYYVGDEKRYKLIHRFEANNLTFEELDELLSKLEIVSMLSSFYDEMCR